MTRDNPTPENTSNKEKASPPAAAKPVQAPKGLRWLQSALALVILLLAGSMILNFYFYSEKALAIRAQNTSHQRADSVSQTIETIQENLKGFFYPGLRTVELNSVANMASISARYFETGDSTRAFMVLNNLPPITKGYYHLWGFDQDNKIADGGIFFPAKTPFVKVKPLGKSRTIIITREETEAPAMPNTAATIAMGQSKAPEK